MIEHVDDDREALANIRSVLAAGGRAVILVPQGPWNFGTLDEVLGHRRRYTQRVADRSSRARPASRSSGCSRSTASGTLAWFLNGKMLRRRDFGLVQIKLLNLLVPLMRLIDACCRRRPSA